ncbi:MAG: methionyl aminopeptidase [Promethearchaeota archaeon CR_4]|nr:MAG: methionyl aminopeptidase [Candidatus Lokiarchaeota archaeon CR_4]
MPKAAKSSTTKEDSPTGNPKSADAKKEVKPTSKVVGTNATTKTASTKLARTKTPSTKTPSSQVAQVKPPAKSHAKPTSKALATKPTTPAKIGAEASQPQPEEKKEKTEEEKKAERLANYRAAGKIAREVKAFITPQIKVGMKILDLCDAIENKITELGGECGFPANISINNKAAHYTASPKDTSVLQDGDVVKVDFGVHKEGCIVDMAFTVNFSKDPNIKDIAIASEEAVKRAVKIIKAGSKTNELGKIIERTVKKYGFRPIQNLTGHLLEEWIVHGEKAIPTVERPHGDEMLENEVYAVEVFATTGEGRVTSSGKGEIFQLDMSSARVPIRNKAAKQILGIIYKKYKSLPFAKRWIAKDVKAYEFAMRELERAKKLDKYGVLQEKEGTYISQFEQTVLVTKEGCEPLTD